MGCGSMRFIHRARATASVPAVKEQNVKYPPVTPRWPPGLWGELDEKRAWELYDKVTEFEDTTCLWDKLNKLVETEHFFFEIKPFVCNSPPRLLPFQKFITKTHSILDELPKLYEDINVDSDLELIKPLLCQILVREKGRIDEKFAELKDNPTLDISPGQITEEMCSNIMKSVIEVIGNHLRGSCDHLLWAQTDEYPTQEAFWSLAGMKEEFDELTDDGFMHLQYTHQPNLTLRVDHPLPVMANLDDEVCVYPDMPMEWHYIPKVYEIGGSEHNGRINCGYLTKTPFNDGCPSEFTQLSVTCIPGINELRENYSEKEICDLATGCSVISGFGSCLTQAHSQGFTWWNDVTYPITSQSMVFDGKNITFSVYQMNTMALWKIGEKGVLHNNVCWSLPEIPLFDSINEDSVSNLNDDALRTLIKFLKLKPQDRGINLRPYLTEKPSDVQSFINRIDEPVIERPHPPRLYAKSKKVKLVSPVVVTRERIDRDYLHRGKYWDEKTGRFVPGKILSRPNNRIRKNDS